MYLGETPQKGLERHDPGGLRRARSPVPKIGIVAHDDVAVLCQVVELELIEDVRVVIFNGILTLLETQQLQTQ